MPLLPVDAIAYTCGLCGPPNPGGVGGWGYTIRETTTSTRLLEDRGRVAAGPEVTNNVVEYVAVGKAVQAYREALRPGPLVIRSSSRLVISQMSGEWPARQGAYIEALRAVQSLVALCSFDIQWEWVPISKNMWAADLAKSALVDASVVSLRP